MTTRLYIVLMYGEAKPLMNSLIMSTQELMCQIHLISPVLQGLYHQTWQGGNES